MVRLEQFLFKIKSTTKSPPRVSIQEVILSWLGAFVGISVLTIIHYKLLDHTAMSVLVGSFGASAALVFGAVRSPFSQPRNLVGGHVISALCGVIAYRFFGFEPWIACSLGVSGALALMHITRTFHPPGGATALIAIIGGEEVHRLGFLYCIVPVGAGSIILLLVALIINNIPKNRKYPQFWF